MKKLFWAITTAFFAFNLTAQSNQRIPVSIAQLTDSIQSIMAEAHIAGLMMGIVTSDSVLYSGGLGYADLAAGRKSTDSTLFRMGSITKMFVSAGMLQLAAQGKLQLQDEVKKIAPEIEFENRWETEHPLRLIHLLEHTSGFDDTKLNHMYAFGNLTSSGLDMVKVHQHSLLCRWKPGQRYSYSNPNYAILGYIIQKLSGQTYDRYLDQHILMPLGMTHSNFNLGSQSSNKNVKEYIVKQGKAVEVPSVTMLSGPQGALWSSAADMIKFLQTLLRNGSPVLSPSSLAEMETHHSSPAASALAGSLYAMGNRPANLFGKFSFRGHDGLAGTCYSSLNYNRSLNIGYVLASNSNVRNTRIEQLIIRYIEQLRRNDAAATPVIQPLNLTAVIPYLGRYQFENPRNEIAAFKDKLLDAPRLFLKNNRLFLQSLSGGEAEELKQTAPLTFTLRESNLPLVHFTKDEKGNRIIMVSGAYYQQTNNIWALAKRGLLAIAVLLLAASVLITLVCIFSAITGRLKCRYLLMNFIPLLGIVALLWGGLNLLEVQLYTYKLAELNTLNARSFAIFAGTGLFGIMALFSLVLAAKYFNKMPSNWLAWYHLLTSIAMGSLAFILWQNGLLGLRTWAM